MNLTRTQNAKIVKFAEKKKRCCVNDKMVKNNIFWNKKRPKKILKASQFAELLCRGQKGESFKGKYNRRQMEAGYDPASGGKNLNCIYEKQVVGTKEFNELQDRLSDKNKLNENIFNIIDTLYLTNHLITLNGTQIENYFQTFLMEHYYLYNINELG